MPDLREAARQFVGFGHPREALKLSATVWLTISNSELLGRFVAAWPKFRSVERAKAFRAIASARTEAIEAVFAARKSKESKR
ncbi:hypothetical protein [Rhodobacter capsulatus]|jgi:hypothetical protein|uniref:Uncharacterized protein n=1 Tax=Rhodobacter capsulatus (strain ATCC BAA-309 / NBRC 16581 / SB1003) TaxID=272942 RepID=D5APV2_RHOCB|nr:hypothetical protein [Rhodobacter capsulatus]ADE86671.1 hypothetical protein RCAP_rcc02944 [Rhodobacter capsulatus SB 1003]ETD00537.1 hypothetical protein U714_16140 [Rhodobacter capsulatus DE442]ETD74877.1 hypothetical protein U717_16105 [Rhodobacter capsulatus R121]ETE52617.1 hypothetical protein U715_16095 [Rhodobacter capsulatus Y262]MDS0928472.1 hypothetical protein [Rhodobacter capsulatus]